MKTHTDISDTSERTAWGKWMMATLPDVAESDFEKFQDEYTKLHRKYKAKAKGKGKGKGKGTNPQSAAGSQRSQLFEEPEDMQSQQLENSLNIQQEFGGDGSQTPTTPLPNMQSSQMELQFTPFTPR